MRTILASRKHARFAAALTVLAAGGLASTTVSCSDSTSPATITTLGPETAMAGGTGRTYVVADQSGMPLSVGVRFNNAALLTLPPGPMVDYTFALPVGAASMPYTHVVIGWNPSGHPPTVYLTPHLDVHFYQIPVAARDLMTPADPQFNAKLASQPAPAFIPTGYVLTPGGVPRMGAHWSDPASPEQNGQPFTSTFIYGSYDGAFIFAEPMVATSFLMTHPAFTSPLKLPARYATSGNYPTAYSVTYNATSGEYQIALESFVAR